MSCNTNVNVSLTNNVVMLSNTLVCLNLDLYLKYGLNIYEQNSL